MHSTIINHTFALFFSMMNIFQYINNIIDTVLKKSYQ